MEIVRVKLGYTEGVTEAGKTGTAKKLGIPNLSPSLI
jgi:hypothetical protein